MYSKSLIIDWLFKEYLQKNLNDFTNIASKLKYFLVKIFEFYCFNM